MEQENDSDRCGKLTGRVVDANGHHVADEEMPQPFFVEKLLINIRNPSESEGSFQPPTCLLGYEKNRSLLLLSNELFRQCSSYSRIYITCTTLNMVFFFAAHLRYDI